MRERFDVVIDPVGGDLRTTSLDVMAPLGRLLAVGNASGDWRHRVEIIRLWVASTEFTEELRVGKEILTRVVDSYRKLRNTCRILVANLYDFDPSTDMVPLEGLDEVDRFALARYAEAAQKILRAYEDYDFSVVSQTLNTLATVDLSAFYVDVTKDRMYTLGAKSRERRSTQTVMYLISDGLARLLAYSRASAEIPSASVLASVISEP